MQIHVSSPKIPGHTLVREEQFKGKRISYAQGIPLVVYTDKWIARSIDSKTSRSGAQAISTPPMKMGPRIREWADMSQPQRAHFPLIRQSRAETPSKCNPMLAYLGDVVGWLANQRLGDCDCRLIPERPPVPAEILLPTRPFV
jgi:hypothetical protein